MISIGDQLHRKNHRHSATEKIQQLSQLLLLGEKELFSLRPKEYNKLDSPFEVTDVL